MILLVVAHMNNYFLEIQISDISKHLVAQHIKICTHFVNTNFPIRYRHATNSYMCFNPRMGTILVSRDVIFFETNFSLNKLIGLQGLINKQNESMLEIVMTPMSILTDPNRSIDLITDLDVTISDFPQSSDEQSMEPVTTLLDNDNLSTFQGEASSIELINDSITNLQEESNDDTHDSISDVQN